MFSPVTLNSTSACELCVAFSSFSHRGKTDHEGLFHVWSCMFMVIAAVFKCITHCLSQLGRAVCSFGLVFSSLLYKNELSAKIHPCSVRPNFFCERKSLLWLFCWLPLLIRGCDLAESHIHNWHEKWNYDSQLRNACKKWWCPSLLPLLGLSALDSSICEAPHLSRV